MVCSPAAITQISAASKLNQGFMGFSEHQASTRAWLGGLLGRERLPTCRGLSSRGSHATKHLELSDEL